MQVLQIHLLVFLILPGTEQCWVSFLWILFSPVGSFNQSTSTFNQQKIASCTEIGELHKIKSNGILKTYGKKIPPTKLDHPQLKIHIIRRNTEIPFSQLVLLICLRCGKKNCWGFCCCSFPLCLFCYLYWLDDTLEFFFPKMKQFYLNSRLDLKPAEVIQWIKRFLVFSFNSPS